MGNPITLDNPTTLDYLNLTYFLSFVVYYPAATEGAATAATDRTEGLLFHLFLVGFSSNLALLFTTPQRLRGRQQPPPTERRGYFSIYFWWAFLLT